MLKDMYLAMTRDVSLGYHGECPESVARNLVVDMASNPEVMSVVGPDLAMLAEALNNNAKAWDVLNAVKQLVIKASVLLNNSDVDDFQAECELRSLILDYQDFIGDQSDSSDSSSSSQLLAL